MWGNSSVSVVLMTYRERESIRSVIEDFFATGVVDEVVVIDNNAEPGTLAEVAKTAARHIVETRQGYGHASRRGMNEAIGDIVVLAEPDGTFVAADIFKLLVYSDQFDVVFGTRTHPQLIWEGANMPWHLRLGNILVARGLRFLYRSAPITDVGCTFRLFTRNAVDHLLPVLETGGSQLGPELMARSVLAGMRHIEVPVNYMARVGTSSVTGDVRRAVLLGFQMIGMLIWLRTKSVTSQHRVHIRRHPDRLPHPPSQFADEIVVDLRVHDRHPQPESEVGSG